MTRDEREVLDKKEKEVQRLQQELRKSPKKKKKKGKKEAEGESEPDINDPDDQLHELMKKAQEDMLAAKKAFNSKLAQVKRDEKFQKQAKEYAEEATLRFSADFHQEDAPEHDEPDKVKASRGLLKALGRNLLGSAKRVSAMTGSLFGGKSKAKGSSGSASQQGGGLGETRADAKSTEEESRDILSLVRKANKGQSPANLFRTLGGWDGAGALTPMVFAKFLLGAAPGTKPTSVGTLWWRADVNGDGQVDLQEFKDFFKNHVDTAS